MDRLFFEEKLKVMKKEEKKRGLCLRQCQGIG